MSSLCLAQYPPSTGLSVPLAEPLAPFHAALHTVPPLPPSHSHHAAAPHPPRCPPNNAPADRPAYPRLAGLFSTRVHPQEVLLDVLEVAGATLVGTAALCAAEVRFSVPILSALRSNRCVWGVG
jgi:hypothetical protein